MYNMKKTYKLFLFGIICIITVLALKLFQYSYSTKPDNKSSKIETSIQHDIKEKYESENILSSKNPPNNLKYVHVTFPLNVNDEPDYNFSDPPIFPLELSSEVSLIKEFKTFMYIDFSGKKGWIPSWYLSNDAMKIHCFDKAYNMITKEYTQFYFFPNAKMPNNYYNDLEKGKVVRVIAQYLDWYSVKLLRYDTEEYDPIWIKKDQLMEYNRNLVKEGYLKNESVLCSEDGTPTSETLTGPVKIEKEYSKVYYVVGAGGQSGYILKSDFIPFGKE